jgi:hypothetical protein
LELLFAANRWRDNNEDIQSGTVQGNSSDEGAALCYQKSIRFPYNDLRHAPFSAGSQKFFGNLIVCPHI